MKASLVETDPARVHHLQNGAGEKGGLPLKEDDQAGPNKTKNDAVSSTERQPVDLNPVNQGFKVAYPAFKLLEFNNRRHIRGKEAARVEVIWEDATQWLWMSRKDVMNNIRLFGEEAGLIAALNAYKQGHA